MGREGDSLQRDAEALASRLRRIPRQQQATVRRQLRDALDQRPDLVVRRELRPWLLFGDIKAAVEQVDTKLMGAAADTVSGWLSDNDCRLSSDPTSDVKAPVDELRPELFVHLSTDAAALLNWQNFRQSMTGRDVAAWSAALRRRLELGGSVDQSDVPVSVLRHDEDLARKVGPLAMARLVAFLLSEPGRQGEALRELSAQWLSIELPRPSDLESFTDALRGVDVETLLTAELPAALCVAALWDQLLGAPELFSRLDFESRTLAIYRAKAEGVSLDVATLDEPNGLALAAALIYTAEPRDPRAAQQAQQAISTVVIEHGWVNPDPPSLRSLLPACDVSESPVSYCEGKPDGNHQVWCPRLRRHCDDSRTSPDHSRNWWDWSLLELMGAAQIEWRRGKHTTWANDLAGWLNRWHDLYERLRCRSCGSVMNPDYGYSRALTAAYGKTVMECPQPGPGHDRNVYLNHCHGCSEPIDSRECPIRTDGYYLCIWCGSGPESVEPGTVCPKCGSTLMVARGRSRWRDCTQCTHAVHVP